ncbi:class A beta-lactamase [Streptomyces kunmingensis]|uniref:Beta-lactamase n=1 Tax=Streptomyces kunmingensis TaxID=68225 RepID=A0ABU6CNJ9_9ACTN|nr:class A beta-lactamase [Streptomyces kunmingensis]MEB3966237.1 class A beta-lactamase [Streptomyces kunmingensis]
MRISRRTLLTTGTALGATALIGTGTAHAVTGSGSGTDTAHAADGGLGRRLAALEREHGARLGVFARNLRTGAVLTHRADERFPLCSTFKTLAVAAVLRDLDHDGTFLARRIHYTQADIDRAGGAPVTGRAENLAHGMTVAGLCGAAISYSDNTAANLLLGHLGGPTAVTRFARSAGDRVTRLDRVEPELNSAEPGRVTDTTSPRAIGTTYARLVLGKVLDPGDRARLAGWLLANTTSTKRFRAGLPRGWVLADKTGTGSYGTANDVGIAWTPSGAPVVLSVLTTKPAEDATPDDELVARTAELIASM